MPMGWTKVADKNYYVLRLCRPFLDEVIAKQQAELTASDGAAGDDFGYSVAVSGSTVIGGAPFRQFGSNGSQGAAYVFVESGGTWSQ